MIHEKRNSSYRTKKSKKNIGFYIALAICVVTVAGAAWTTYGSVMEYHGETESSQQEELPAGNDVSGEKYHSGEPEENSTESSTESSEEESSGVESEGSADEANTEPEEPTYCPPVEEGKTIKPYSPQDPLFSRTTSDWRTHPGMDISAEEGCAVRSMTDGVVKSVSKNEMLGNMICIQSDSYEIRYCGMSEKPIVSEGNHVQAGDTIGYVGLVPGELLDDSHIHIEVRHDGELIDPDTLALNK